MQKAIDLAWKIIDKWIAEDYGGNRLAAEEELGDLDNLSYRMLDIIEAEDLTEKDGLTYVSSELEFKLF